MDWTSHDFAGVNDAWARHLMELPGVHSKRSVYAFKETVVIWGNPHLPAFTHQPPVCNLLTMSANHQSREQRYTPAEEQFHTSSQYPKPVNWTGSVWAIRNDYPGPPRFSFRALITPVSDATLDAPWLTIDFKTHPGEYAKTIKEYCWEGNRQVDFVVQENRHRAWYHAPWMHASANGREPLKGLTFERSMPPHEFASTQTHALQNWAIGFYNSPGASTFGYVWKDPNNPNWTHNLKFPEGTCVFKLLFTTASDDQVFTMKGAPGWHAVISPQPNLKVAPRSGAERNDHASQVRLIQVDWAVVDSRAPIGWVFGTFMYNSNLWRLDDPWDRLTAIGVQWGNDPQLNQAAYDAGKRPVESWINPEAESLRKQLGGRRPFWGYNGRLNGPADNFISACASCHSVAQLITSAPITQPRKLVNNKFENVKSGEAFSARGAVSADYSLQLKIGFENYQTWLAEQASLPRHIPFSTPGRRVVFRAKPGAAERSHEGKDPMQETKDSIVARAKL
ncbi:hypothetical protein FRB94_014378 [Tulasnella sp. JGI-2019a]|nr:hypothetical protein FRB94_014378 [Tulasnella sp. JGI-2019a]